MTHLLVRYSRDHIGFFCDGPIAFGDAVTLDWEDVNCAACLKKRGQPMNQRNLEDLMAPQYKYQSSVWDILEAMKKYGGSFIKHLAILYNHADDENRRKLEALFQEYFRQYDDIAMKTRGK
jgi:hypothetical protein